MAKIRGLTEVVISVHDMEKSLNFYRDILGLKVMSPPDFRGAVFLLIGEQPGTAPQQLVLIPLPEGTDAFPTEPSQWNDTDGDGFGDNSSGSNGDDCPSVAGSSIVVGSLGCADTDSDGVPDNVDLFPDDATQSADTDGDGFGDDVDGTEGDDCPSVSGGSFEGGTYGCLDSDLDGWANTIDAFPNELTQWNDTDGDGYGDNGAGFEGDGCPTEVGSSTLDVLGCPDSDGDGYSDEGDAFENESGQWLDSDGDGYGDNPSPATLFDDCPTTYGNSTADRQGCYDSDANITQESIDSFSTWCDI